MNAPGRTSASWSEATLSTVLTAAHAISRRTQGNTLLIDRDPRRLERRRVPFDLGTDEGFKVGSRASVGRHHVGAVCGKLFLHCWRFHSSHASVVKLLDYRWRRRLRHEEAKPCRAFKIDAL